MEKIRRIILFPVIFIGLMHILLISQEYEQTQSQIPSEMKEVTDFFDSDRFEAFIDGIMTVHLEAENVAGAVFVAVKDGKIFLAKGYGWADVKNKKPVSPHRTLFRPGSVSKLFTWTAVMQLVEQGKLDLNTDVNTYLKEFKIPETFPAPITMKHLMTHTPGFEESSAGLGVRKAEDLVPLVEFLAENMPARIFPPGELAAYSNYGTALAGHIVELISGKPFETYIEENIFDPLGMNHSTFRQPLPDNLAENMSIGYTYKKGMFVEEDFELINGMAPAGSLSTTAADMARFMTAHLQYGEYNGSRILEENTARDMHTQLFTHDPRIEGNAYGFWEWKHNGLRMLEHGGDTFLFHSRLVLIPEKNMGVFVSYNSAGGGGAPRSQLVNSILDRYFPGTDILEIKPLPDFKKRAKQFCGIYGVTRTVQTTYAKLMSLVMTIKVSAARDGGALLVTMPNGPKTNRWVETAPLVFRERGGQGILIFREDDSGHITHLFLSQVPMMAGVKLAPHETPFFHICLLVFCLIFFLSTLCWPIGALRRLICKREKEESNVPKAARWAAGGMSALFVFFLIGLGAMLADPIQFMFGVPSGFKILLVFPLIAGVIALGVLFFTCLAWMKKYWTICSRVHYTLLFLAALLFCGFLFYWNLLGFNF